MSARIKPLIAIDSWKLKIFEKRLNDANFMWEVSHGVAKDMLFIKLKTNRIVELAHVVMAANNECKRSKLH